MNLFDAYELGGIRLSSRIAMAPMTRSRAIGNLPNELMARYYGQRSSAGLIVTEGTAPSPNALGYPRIPGAYSDAQVEGWQHVTAAAHRGGARIFLQLMHVGRIAHPANMPPDAEIVAPSAIRPAGQMWTDQRGLQDYPTPRTLGTDELPAVIAEFVHAAENGMRAGFDGVELHGANGYLIEQFLNAGTNLRDDAYGGTIGNRNRFAVEVAAAVAGTIGAGRTGMRLSPFNTFNDMPEFEDTAPQYEQLAEQLGRLRLAYLHLVNYRDVGERLNVAIRKAFGRTLILNGGLDRRSAEAALAGGLGDIAAFASAFLANPDLPHRLLNDLPLNAPKPDTFYTPGEDGYTDYPPARED